MFSSNINDRLNYLSKFTFKKLLNVALIKSSFYLSKLTKRNIHWGMPYGFGIEPTTACNLRCPGCLSGIRDFDRPTGMLSQDFFEKTINDLHKYLLYCTLHYLGEPYLNKSLFNFVKYASERKIYTELSTNGHYLNDENAKQTILSGLDSIRISIDGTTQEVYEMYRKGGNLNTVIEGVKNLVRWKERLGSKTPFVIVQLILFKYNTHQTGDIEKLAQEMGADELQLKTADSYISNEDSDSSFIPEDEKYSRYKKQQNGSYKLASYDKMPNHCFRMWHSFKTTWDGSVIPCCFDKNSQYIMGDFKKESFKKIWRGEKYDTFRSQLFNSRKSIGICNNCIEGMESEIRQKIPFK